MSDQRLKERLAPGIWIDQDDALHLNVPDILEQLGVPYTEENERQARSALMDLITQQVDDAEVHYQNRCPSCQAKGTERHKAGCVYGT